jgi:zinc-binding alcohol dehydrogenase/oxidoreductase
LQAWGWNETSPYHVARHLLLPGITPGIFCHPASLWQFAAMNALVLDASSFSITTIPDPLPGPGEIAVTVLAAALNRRDQWIRDGKYAKIDLPAVLGSDACGLTADGRRVVINPSFNWGDDPRAQGHGFHILGMPTQGTLAQRITVPEANVHTAPSHLSDLQAAALPLAGVTAYRSVVVRGMVRPDETVLVTGIGGGVATLAMAMALACGARVYVSSGSQSKLDKAIALGAAGGVLYTDPQWPKQLTEMAGPIDVAIDSAAGAPMNDVTSVMRPGGRIVVYGATLGTVPQMNMHRVFWKQLTIMGSTMGTPDDFAAMLRFVETHRIVPVIDSVFPFADAVSAFERIRMSDQFGKIVVDLR